MISAKNIEFKVGDLIVWKCWNKKSYNKPKCYRMQKIMVLSNNTAYGPGYWFTETIDEDKIRINDNMFLNTRDADFDPGVKWIKRKATKKETLFWNEKVMPQIILRKI